MKKITAIILSLLMAFQIAAFAEESPVATDTIVAEEELKLLSELGLAEIFADGTYQSDATVTRGDIAYMISKLVADEEEIPEAKGNVFSDVSKDHWAADYIEYLYTIGCVNGNGGGAYRPDAPALYEEAVKLFVTVLGHQIRAEQKAAYPDGYIATGMNIGLLKNVKAGIGQTLSYADMYKMLYNAITSERLVMLSFGKEAEYTISDVTLLEDRFNAFEVNGRVDADEISFLKSNGKESEGRIRIDGVSYKLSASVNGENLLGLYVKGYAREKDGDMELIVLEKDENQEIISLNAKDILDGSGGFGSVSGTPEFVYYNKAGKTQKLEIPKTAVVIRNGVYVGRASEVTNDIVIPDSGYVEILKNKDGAYDTVRVCSFVYYVIRHIDAKNLRMTDQFGKEELVLDRLDKVNYKVYNKGEEVQFGDLIEGDVVAISADKNDLSAAKNITLTRLSDVVEGTIEVAGDDEFTINGKDYAVSPGVVYQDDMIPAPGMKGKFYLGTYGEIVLGVLEEKNPEGYAYLVKMQANKNGLKKAVYVQLFTTEGKMEVMEFDDEVRLNGNAAAEKTAVSQDPVFYSGTEVKPQLIRYKRNSKGYITDIFTENAPGGVNLTASFGGEVFLNRATIGAEYIADNETWYFEIPTYDDPKDSDYKVQLLMDFNSAQVSGISVYDVDEYCVAGCVVRKVGSTFMSIELGSASTALVKRLTYSTNGDEDCVRVHVIIDGVENYADFPLHVFEKMKDTNGDGVGDKGVVPGDVILYLTDANRLVTQSDVLFDSENERDKVFTQWYVSTGGMTDDYVGNALLYTVNGTINTLKDNILLADVRCKVNNAYIDTVRPYKLEGVRVYVYDASTREKVRTGYLGELREGDKVFMRGTRTILREIIVYK